jgi:hypothetical protein
VDDHQLQPAPPDATAPAAAWLSTVLVSGPYAPHGFTAAARLLHPASDADLNPVPWAHVAIVTGHPLHPDSTFDDIAGTVHTRRTTRNDWPGGPPELGELGDTGWDALLSHLTLYSGSTTRCLIAIDDSLTWVTGGPGVQFYGDPHHVEPPQDPAFPTELLDSAPRFWACSRSYLLLTAPLAALRTLGRTWRYQDQRWFERHSPSLLWPTDRSWLVATDLDYDYTYLAGPRLLLDAALADHRLESQPQDTTPPS